MRTEGRMIGNGIRNWCWRKHRRRTTHWRRPQVELLERRELLATAIVTQPFGDGPGSLPDIARTAAPGTVIQFDNRLTKVTLDAPVDVSGLTLDGGGDVTITGVRDGLTVRTAPATVENLTLSGSVRTSFTGLRAANKVMVKDVVFTNWAIGVDVSVGASVDFDGAELIGNSIGMNNEGRVTLDHVSFASNASGGLINHQHGNAYATNSNWSSNSVAIRNWGGILDVFSSGFDSNTSPSATTGAVVDSPEGGTVYLIGVEVNGSSGGPAFATSSQQLNSVFAVEDSDVSDNHAGVLFTDGSEGLVFFADVTMRGNVSEGPQILHRGHKLLLEYSTFEGNVQQDGGVLLMEGEQSQEQQLEILYVLWKDNISQRPTTGGALAASVRSGSSVNVRNSTFTGNDAGGGQGGAIWLEGDLAGGGEVRILSSDFVGNTARLGGAIFNQVQRPANVTLDNNIIQMNGGGNLRGVFSGDYNIVDDATGATGLTGIHNQIGTAALLAPLASYQGSIYPPVFALFSDSPGVGEGDPKLASPLGSKINIGATNVVVQRPTKPPTGDPVNPPPITTPEVRPIVVPRVLFINISRRMVRLVRASVRTNTEFLFVRAFQVRRNGQRRLTITIRIERRPLFVVVRSMNGEKQTPLGAGDFLVVRFTSAQRNVVRRLFMDLVG